MKSSILLYPSMLFMKLIDKNSINIPLAKSNYKKEYSLQL